MIQVSIDQPSNNLLEVDIGMIHLCPFMGHI